MIMPPQSAFGTIDPGVRLNLISQSPLKSKYSTTVDRESAYEILQNRVARQQASELEEEQRREKQKQWEESERQKSQRSNPFDMGSGKKSKSTGSGYQRQTTMEKAANAVVTTIGREVSRSLIRGILGSLKK